MTKDIEEGLVSAVLVKDLSRLGRDYLQVGYYTDVFFPENDTRFIAINDNIDSNDGEDEFMPFRNVMNEWYARDASKKVKTAHRMRGMSGEPLGHPPYGYMKDPYNPKRWIIDPEPAAIVRRIFDLALSGKGSEQIATQLTKENVLNPMAYWASQGIKRGGGKRIIKSPFSWASSSINGFFKVQEYCGDVINFKTSSKSFRSKKRVNNAPEDVVVFKDVHEPIISREDFERVNEKRAVMVRKRDTITRRNLFSGLLRCAGCGANLHFHFNQTNHSITYYNCSNYNSGSRVCDSTHYVRADFLEKVVLAELRCIVKLAKVDEDVLAKSVVDVAMSEMNSQVSSLRRSIDTLKARDKELNRLFECIYEDKVSGLLDAARFSQLSKRYGDEQEQIREKVVELEEELNELESKSLKTEDFVNLAKQCREIKRLTPKLVNQFIDWIEIHQAIKVGGIYEQRIDIYFNCVGHIRLSEEVEDIVPFKEVALDTRKGVRITNSLSKQLTA